MTVIKESHLFSITAVLTAPAATSREQTAIAAAAAAAATAVTDNTAKPCFPDVGVLCMSSYDDAVVV